MPADPEPVNQLIDNYDSPTLLDERDIDYDLSTLFDNNSENNMFYSNATTDTHDYNVHDVNLSSMRAQSMMDLGLRKKGFKMCHLNILGIQNKIDWESRIK